MAKTERLAASESVREELVSRLHSSKARRSLADCAWIVLLSSEGLSAEVIGQQISSSRRTVYKWPERFEKEGVEGPRGLPRPGQSTKMTREATERILGLTTQRIPKEATHWSARLMAKYAGVTEWQVRQVWSTSDLKPHRLKTFKISKDPAFTEKVVDVVGLYLNLPDNAVVLSADEKRQIQALDRTQPMLPLRPGQIQRRTHDYKRNGTASLYAAFDIATGKVMGRITLRHRAKEFLVVLRQVDRTVEPGQDLHLILDNSSTHKTAEVKSFLEQRQRIKLHFTPTSASWLNAVETWFSQLERRSLHRGVFTSVKELRDEIRRYIEAHNQEAAKPFTWTKSAKVVLDAVERAKAATSEMN